MAASLQKPGSVQLPELLQERTLLTEICTWLLTFITLLVTCGGMYLHSHVANLASGFKERSSILTDTTRNLGIMIALMIFGCSVYLVATEYISAKKSKGEVLLFRRGRVPYLQPKMDEEANADDRINAEMLAQEKPVLDTPAGLQKQTAVFQWNDVNYDIKVNKKPQRLLDRVDGWVKPGTLTALMVCLLL